MADPDTDEDEDADADPIVIKNYRGVIEAETWERFKRGVPRDIMLEDRVNELIREDAWDEGEGPTRKANSNTPNTTTETE